MTEYVALTREDWEKLCETNSQHIRALETRVRELELRLVPVAKVEAHRASLVEINLKNQIDARTQQLSRITTELNELIVEWTAKKNQRCGNFSTAARQLVTRVLAKHVKRCAARHGYLTCALGDEHQGPHYDHHTAQMWSVDTSKGGEV